MIVTHRIELPDPAATAALAERLASKARAGDRLLLAGPIGAGKSELARTIIQTLQRDRGQAVEDVPSPTYTLIQTYMAGELEIWHADLYRLGDTSELEELGLVDVWDSALTLVEWPERLGDAKPDDAIEITISPTPDGREAFIAGPENAMMRLLEESTT